MPHLFIARTQSTLQWLRDLPVGWDVTVHDEHGDLDVSQLPRAVRLMPPQPGGRAAVYLHFLATTAVLDPRDVTVLCGDEPLAHAPDFLRLLAVPHLWGDVQPLSTISAVERAAPPPALLMHDRRDHIGDCAVRAERFSVHTLQPVAWHDALSHRRAESWRLLHDLPEGTSMLAHFLEDVGLTELAREAREADIGMRAPGDVFGVRNVRILQVQRQQRDVLAGLIERARQLDSDPAADLLFESTWLHLLGEPFVVFETNERPDERTEPVEQAMARVVATIDAVLAQSTGLATARAAANHEAEPRSIETLREQARIAAAAGRPDEAQRLLQQALLRDPKHLGVVTDAAGLAWQTGRIEEAAEFARQGLALDRQASTCTYVLGMAQARHGDRSEARQLLTGLVSGETHQWFRRERPDLAEAAQRELERLMLLPGAIIDTDPQPPHQRAA